MQSFLPALKRLPCDITLRSANGSPLTGLRRYLIKFTINEHTAVFPFIISENLRTTCILGSDFMSHFNYFISPRTGHALRDISPYLPSSLPSTPIKDPLTAHTDITIPPSAEKIIKVDVPTDDVEISVNPDNVLIPQSLVIVAPAIVKVNNKVANVVVSNPTLFPFKILRNQTLCSYQSHAPNSSSSFSVDSILTPVANTQNKQNKNSGPIIKADLNNIPIQYRPKFQALLQQYS